MGEFIERAFADPYFLRFGFKPDCALFDNPKTDSVTVHYPYTVLPPASTKSSQVTVETKRSDGKGDGDQFTEKTQRTNAAERHALHPIWLPVMLLLFQISLRVR